MRNRPALGALLDTVLQHAGATKWCIAGGADQGRHPQPDSATNWEGDAESDAWAADLELLSSVADMDGQIHACEAAACSLWALIRHWGSPQVRRHETSEVKQTKSERQHIQEHVM